MKLRTGAMLIAACALVVTSLSGCAGGGASSNPTSAGPSAASSAGPAAKTISGKVGYAGTVTPMHQIIVVAVRQGEQSPAYSTVLPEPGAYSFSGVTDGRYTISAFMDMGDDMGPPGANEPSGVHDTNGDGQTDPVTIQNGTGLAGIDVVLKDK